MNPHTDCEKMEAAEQPSKILAPPPCPMDATHPDTIKYFDTLVDDLEVQFHAVDSKFRSARDFKPQPSDVFVISWMKSGTTLMQNLMYQLMVATNRVPTDPSGTAFRDISAVVPYVEMTHICGVYTPVHPYVPVVWKTHAFASDVTAPHFQNCRFVYLIRDGREAARSYLDFTADWLSQRRCHPQLRAHYYSYYFLRFFLNRKYDAETSSWRERSDRHNFSVDWFRHVGGWLKAPLNNLLILAYEDVVADMPQTVRTIAKFLDISVDDAAVSRVVSACDHKKMSEDSRFNDVMVSENYGLDTTGGRRARRPGEVGFGKFALSEECQRLYHEDFYKAVGEKDYEALVVKVRERTKRQMDNNFSA